MKKSNREPAMPFFFPHQSQLYHIHLLQFVDYVSMSLMCRHIRVTSALLSPSSANQQDHATVESKKKKKAQILHLPLSHYPDNHPSSVGSRLETDHPSTRRN